MLEPFSLETEIIPSPGTQITDWETMEQKIGQVKSFAHIVHIDIVDGKFAPNTTFSDPVPFAKYTKDTLFEVHLMVEDPLKHLEKWANAGFHRFIGQVEMMPDLPAFVAQAQEFGEVGLAIDAPTSVEKLSPYLEDLDVAFVMTVKAGQSRQKFLPEQLEKVRAIREKASYLPIEIDGGVNAETIVKAKEAGATRFVTTGYVFDSSSPVSQYESLQAAVAD